MADTGISKRSSASGAFHGLLVSLSFCKFVTCFIPFGTPNTKSENVDMGWLVGLVVIELICVP